VRGGALALGVLLLAGCARSLPEGVTASAAASTAASATPSQTSSPPGVAAVLGCPAAQSPAGPAPVSTVVLTQADDQAPSRTLALGQTLEIRLSTGVRWHVLVDDPSHALTPASSQGWYDAALGACVWRFLASGVGSVTLVVNGVIICQSTKPSCATAAEVLRFSVVVR
jgi:hypothetical protein